MTDKEIIKALNIATNIDGLQVCCIDYENNPETKTFLSIKSDIVDLINRQQAEREKMLEDLQFRTNQVIEQQAKIERLADRNKKCIYLSDEETTEHCVDAICPEFKTEAKIKSEAIKEFAEKLKDDSWFTDLYDRNDYPVRAVTKEDIDNLVKEMAGEDK